MRFLRWLFGVDPSVSPAWLHDNERRSWGVGNEEQICWKWPVKK